MNISQHYVINLKRRPERLYAWLGAQSQMGFDFSKLTVVEAFDAAAWHTWGDFFTEFFVYFHENGIDYSGLLGSRKNNTHAHYGHTFLGMTRLAIFLETEKHENDTDYFMMWEDDMCLKVPYEDLLACDLPSDATMVGLHDHYGDSLRHPSKEFRVNPKALRVPQAFLFNKKGASTILDYYRETGDVLDLEHLISKRPDLPGLYTSVKNYTHPVFLKEFYSDLIQDTSRIKRKIELDKGHVIEWNTKSLATELSSTPQNPKVVMMTGSFDLFHAGHARILKESRKLGEALYVGINSDERVRLKKGNDRPIYPLQQRLEILYWNRNVSEVIPIAYIPDTDGDSSERGIRMLLERWNPHIWVDGADQSAKKHAERFSKEYGFKYKVLNCELVHTTQIIEKIRAEA